jgi:hypothetical protein
MSSLPWRGLKEKTMSDAKRICTCHPDDNPPVPCAEKYALSECRLAAMSATPLTFEQYWAACVEGIRLDGLYTLEAVKDLVSHGYYQGALHSEMKLDAMTAERDALRTWHPIETAPRDGTLILVYAPSKHGLPAMFSMCAWHPDAGFCIDELREPSHWMKCPNPPEKP